MTTWNEIPSGDLAAAWSNFLRELGEDADRVLAGFQNNPTYTREVKNFAVERAGGRPNKPRKHPIKNQVTMSAVKRLMGSRCFTAHETAKLLGMTAEEESFIPKIPSRELRKLIRFLQGPCPFISERKAAETHVLFPMPEIVQGRSLDLRFTSVVVGRTHVHIEELDRLCTQPSWNLMFLSPDASFIVPGTEKKSFEDQEEMLPQGYAAAHPLQLVMMLGVWMARDLPLPPTYNRAVRTCAIGSTRTGYDRKKEFNPVLVEIIQGPRTVVRAESPNDARLVLGITASRLIPTR